MKENPNPEIRNPKEARKPRAERSRRAGARTFLSAPRAAGGGPADRNVRAPLLALALLLWLAAPASALADDIPALINYQGKLTDNLGDPVPSGYYMVEFRIWDDTAQTGAGNYIWGRSFPLHVLTNGLFNVLLSNAGDDLTTPGTPKVSNLLDAFAGPNRYLGLTITVNPQGPVTAPQEISPRQQLVSAPYAIRANDAANLGGTGAASYPTMGSGLRAGVVPAFAGSTLTNSALTASGPTKIGINTTSPQAELDVSGAGRFDVLNSRVFSAQAGDNNGLHFGLSGGGSDWAAMLLHETESGGGWNRNLDLTVGNDTNDTLTLRSTGAATLRSEQSAASLTASNGTATVLGKAVDIRASDTSQAVNVYGRVHALGAWTTKQTWNDATSSGTSDATADSDGFLLVDVNSARVGVTVGTIYVENRSIDDDDDNHGSHLYPVAKGEYWKVQFLENLPGNTFVGVYWRPLGL